MDHEAKEWIEKFDAKLENDDAESVVTGLVQLVLMKGQFKSASLYRSIFSAMAGKLYLKTLTWRQEP